MIKAELVEAVDGCIEAAGHEFSPALQRRLLEVRRATRAAHAARRLVRSPCVNTVVRVGCWQAAEFGKGFAEGFRAERLVEMCKALHVINNVRQPDIGMPLSFLQYALTPHTPHTPRHDTHDTTRHTRHDTHLTRHAPHTTRVLRVRSRRYDMLGPEALIERLVNRHLHPLADAIAGFLKLKRDSILIHWASRKVRVVSCAVVRVSCRAACVCVCGVGG
jgi:hypothetical protein